MNEPCHDTALPDAGDAKIAGCPQFWPFQGKVWDLGLTTSVSLNGNCHQFEWNFHQMASS